MALETEAVPALQDENIPSGKRKKPAAKSKKSASKLKSKTAKAKDSNAKVSKPSKSDKKSKLKKADKSAKQNQPELKAYRASSRDEIQLVREAAHEFHAESRYGHIPFSEEKFVRACVRALRDPSSNLSVYVRYGDETVGLLHAGVGDYYLGQGGRMATIYAMYVPKKFRGTFLGGKVGLKLIRMASDWAKAQGAEELHIHATSGIDPERTDKLLTRLGFKTYGGSYVARMG